MVDYTKLNSFVKKCRENGVSQCTIGADGAVTLNFFRGEENKELKFLNFKQPIQDSFKFNNDELAKKFDSPPLPFGDDDSPDEDDEFDDEFLHLQDPVAWEKAALDQFNNSNKKVLATGGDEVDGDEFNG